jgi:hypothetical protein
MYVHEKDDEVQRSNNQGDRLIIIHAITPDGPLGERDDNNVPVSDLIWRGKTCHPTPRTDGKVTCETI